MWERKGSWRTRMGENVPFEMVTTAESTVAVLTYEILLHLRAERVIVINLRNLHLHVTYRRKEHSVRIRIQAEVCKCDKQANSQGNTANRLNACLGLFSHFGGKSRLPVLLLWLHVLSGLHVFFIQEPGWVKISVLADELPKNRVYRSAVCKVWSYSMLTFTIKLPIYVHF